MTNNWIDVEQQLPEPKTIVLCWLANSVTGKPGTTEGDEEALLGYIQNNIWYVWYYSDFLVNANVTHWQRRPSKPNGGVPIA